jgi:hypothetical protein
MNGRMLIRFMSLYIVVVSAAAADPCPSGTPLAKGYSMAAKPDTPKVGDIVDVTLDRAIPQPFTVCLDANVIAPKNTVSQSLTHFEFEVPGDTKGAAFEGVHTVTIIANNLAYTAKLGKATTPTLSSVTSVPLGPGNSVFRFRLNGEGFDATKTDDYTIKLNGYPLDVCWSDSDCAVRHSAVRGDVLFKGTTIQLSGIDPAEERTATFEVLVNSVSIGSEGESDIAYEYWLALGISAAATLVVVGIVLFLVTRLRPIEIEGNTYLGRALFLDKETNTYSLSKFQFYIWTIVAAFGYVYLTLSKNWFQHSFVLPPVPAGLPGIVGIAAGTAIGSQVVTNINGPKGAGQPKPSLADFVTTGDVVAAERVQFFVWTVIGAIGFLLVVARLDPRVLSDLPNVPSSLLAISGLSALGYLGGKLARDPGPVVAEAMISTGPDPDATPPSASGAPPNGPALSASGQMAASIATAKTQLASAKQALQGIAPSSSIQAVIAAANRSSDAATAAIQAAEAGGDAVTLSAQLQKAAADADAAARDAAAALSSLLTDTSKPDSDSAGTAASAAQQASAAAQALFANITSISPQSTQIPGSAPATFGRIDLRGRTLSRDANFRVSLGEESTAKDVDISFDQLQPSPTDDQHLKKPRITEKDPDSTDPDMARRLLLVVNIGEKLRPVFAGGSTHTITIINPDSQKAVFKFQVPESQQPG